MKLMFPLNHNTIPLVFVGIIILLFFISGILNILDHIVIKVLLVTLTSGLAIIVSVILFKKSIIKNRPEDKPQDDFN